jgi:hypothetical protein
MGTKESMVEGDEPCGLNLRREDVGISGLVSGGEAKQTNQRSARMPLPGLSEDLAYPDQTLQDFNSYNGCNSGSLRQRRNFTNFAFIDLV